MPAAKPADPAQPETPAGQDADVVAPARKKRTPKAKPADTTPEEQPAAAAEPAPEEQPTAAEPAGDSATADAAADVPAENLVSGSQFAKMLGFRPTELIGFERKGWLRPVKREGGVAYYNKAEAADIRQDLRQRRQEEADLTRRNRRY